MIITSLAPEEFDETCYDHQLRQVLFAVGRRGRAVIVGRGARFFLPGQFGLSVRLIASPEARVQRIASGQKTTLDQARGIMQKFDRDRAKFIRHHFDQNINEPLLYDLIINTDAISMNAAAETIITAVNQKLGVTAVKKTGMV